MRGQRFNNYGMRLYEYSPLTPLLSVALSPVSLLQSHRTLARVNSFGSPSVILLSLAVSVATAAAAAPFWETTVVSGTGFALRNQDQVRSRTLNMYTMHSGHCLFRHHQQGCVYHVVAEALEIQDPGLPVTPKRFHTPLAVVRAV